MSSEANARVRIVALIPARGGSKRLPRKNLLPFAGQPLLCHSIAVAHAVPRIDRCFVSTDDAEIAEVARRGGADVIHRPAALAGDQASTASAVIHALAELSSSGVTPDIVVLLQPNCPLRPTALVERALDSLLEGDTDSVISVTEAHHKLGTLAGKVFVPEYQTGIRSQDMAPRYFENGVVYASWTKAVLDTGSVFGARIGAVITDPLYAMGDIDTPLDLAVAEFLFEAYRSHFSWAPASVTQDRQHGLTRG